MFSNTSDDSVFCFQDITNTFFLFLPCKVFDILHVLYNCLVQCHCYSLPIQLQNVYTMVIVKNRITSKQRPTHPYVYSGKTKLEY